MEQQKNEIISFKPDLVVGSSFGGALALILAHQKMIDVPILLLAQAYKLYNGKMSLPSELPKDIPILLVHGDDDQVVPLSHSVDLSKTRHDDKVKMVIVKDNHRLHTLIETKSLEKYIEDLFFCQNNGHFTK